MKRTQIQLPDWLFDTARALAEKKEISLAELVRRGLEYMVSLHPEADREPGTWRLPRGHRLESQDPFADPGWRERLHTDRLRMAEEGEAYDPGASP
jgi:hypothetical protein